MKKLFIILSVLILLGKTKSIQAQTVTPITAPVTCKVEVFKGDASMKPMFNKWTSQLPLVQDALKINAGEYYIYGVRVKNNTSQQITPISVSVQQLQGANEPIDVVALDPQCTYSAYVKQVHCTVSAIIGPYAQGLLDTSFLVNILPKTNDPKTSTLFNVQTSAGNTSCANMLFYDTPLPPSPQSIPTCVSSTINQNSSGEVPFNYFFHGSGAAGGVDSGIVGYQWDYDGDGKWDSDVMMDGISYTYQTPGIYNPRYRIKGANGTWSQTCSFPAVINVSPKIKYPISWSTPFATLKASNFSILANTKNWHGSPDIEIHSDPGNDTYTTLEATWHENGIEMRLFIYFAQENGRWRVTEMRTYNGNNPGDWIYYNGFDGNVVGQPLTVASKTYTSRSGATGGFITVENMILQPFLLRPTPFVSTAGYSLDAHIDRSPIVITDASNTGYGINVILRDKDGKVVTNQTGFNYAWNSDDPNIVTVKAYELCAYGIQAPCPRINGQINGFKQGSTSIRVFVNKIVDGISLPIASTVIPVVVNHANMQSCVNVAGTIPTNGQALQCCPGLTLVTSGDDNNLIYGTCRKLCGNDIDCGQNETCIEYQPNIHACMVKNMLYTKSLEQKLNETQKEVAQLTARVNNQDEKQNQLETLVNNLLIFIQKIFRFTNK